MRTVERILVARSNHASMPEVRDPHARGLAAAAADGQDRRVLEAEAGHAHARPDREPGPGDLGEVPARRGRRSPTTARAAPAPFPPSVTIDSGAGCVLRPHVPAGLARRDPIGHGSKVSPHERGRRPLRRRGLGVVGRSGSAGFGGGRPTTQVDDAVEVPPARPVAGQDEQPGLAPMSGPLLEVTLSMRESRSRLR